MKFSKTALLTIVFMVFVTISAQAGIVPISVDIKPQSCPNPINVKSQGVLPVAILGTPDLNINDIDFCTIVLNGVRPTRSAFEDVSTPVFDNECSCTQQGADGFEDVTLKFPTQEIVAVIGAPEKNEVIELTLSANLLDGTPIQGTDCVIVKGIRNNFD